MEQKQFYTRDELDAALTAMLDKVIEKATRHAPDFAPIVRAMKEGK